MRINRNSLQQLALLLIFYEIIIFTGWLFVRSETSFEEQCVIMFIVQFMLVIMCLLFSIAPYGREVPYKKVDRFKFSKVNLVETGFIIDGTFMPFDEFISVTPISVEYTRGTQTNIVKFETSKDAYYILDRDFVFGYSMFSSTSILKKKAPQIKNLIADRIISNKTHLITLKW